MLSEAKGLWAKIEVFNDTFIQMELAYKTLELEHEAKKKEAFVFKFELIQARKELHAASFTLKSLKKS